MVEEIGGHGAAGHAVAADLATADGCRAAVEQGAAALGGVDVLVNCAGAAQGADVLGLPVETIEDALALKSYGYLRMAQLVIPFMRRSGWGRIVNIAGAAGTSPERGNLPVSLANIAVLNMTRALSDAVAGDGILVNTICPGLTNTDSGAAAARRPRGRRGTRGGRVDRRGRPRPAGGDGSPNRRRLRRSLCSWPPGACSYVFGSSVYMDGGLPPRHTVNDMDTGIPSDLRVVVTAGARGIGRAIVEGLREHGVRVHLCDISAEAIAECRAALPDVTASVVDVAAVDQVDAFFDAALDALGGLDVLVNNAGIAGPTAAVEDITVEDWDRTVAVNLNSQFYCARRAVPALRASGRGALINLSSVAGRLGYAYRSVYAATKWAVVGFTQSLAKELGPDGIRVNAILPGVVDGERFDNVVVARAAALGRTAEEVEQEYLSHVSLRRKVSTRDVANMVLFLCSEAGRNVSGQSLGVCGNVEVM